MREEKAINKRTPEDALYIALASKGISNRAIGRLLKVDEKTIRNGLRRAGYESHLFQIDLDDKFQFTLDTPVTLVEDNIAITADWHVPVFDPVYANYFVERCRDFRTRTLVIAGDFFNFDALSKYWPKQESANLEKELDASKNAMRILLETFDKIVYLWGNHDARLHKALGFSIQFKEAMRLVFGSLGEEAINRITFSNLDHLWIKQDDGREWYVCHPQAYSRTALSTARTLSDKFNSNVMTAHAHHCAIGYGNDGKKILVECGGLFDIKKTEYLQRTTTHPIWTQGFSILRNGEPIYLDSPGFRVY